MRTDIDATIRAVELACAFDWTWQPDDVARFCAAAGWTPPVGEGSTKRMSTDLELNHPEARAPSYNGILQNVTFTATDILYEDVPYSEMIALSSANHGVLTDALSEFLGAPTDYFLNESMPITKRWDRPNVVIMLACVVHSVNVRLINPDHQRSVEEDTYLIAKHGISSDS